MRRNKQTYIQFDGTPSFPQVIDESSIVSNIIFQIEQLPDPEKEVMPGVAWGNYGQLFTPAYWKTQYLMHNVNKNFTINYRLGDNILEEVVACLLGGFGLKSEIGLAAFERLKKRGKIKAGTKFSEVQKDLSEPFFSNGKWVHYRFPNQKAKYIALFLNRKDLRNIPLDNDLTLRNWLLTVGGIGPKTASWITRNYLNSEKVAIIDIHIYRACIMMGLYDKNYDVQKDYDKLEQIFINFCTELDVRPSRMDALMWLQMKNSTRNVHKIMKSNY